MYLKDIINSIKNEIEDRADVIFRAKWTLFIFTNTKMPKRDIMEGYYSSNWIFIRKSEAEEWLKKWILIRKFPDVNSNSKDDQNWYTFTEDYIFKKYH